MVNLANTNWRDFNVDGSPSSGAYDPEKGELRAWGAWLESLISAGSLGDNWYATRTLLNADLAHAAGSIAVVYADTTAANNGTYVKSGASGSGSWAQITNFLPGYQVVSISDDGNSTANAYTMDASPYAPSESGAALFIGFAPVENTSTSVTISFDSGATTYPVKTASGGNPPVGALTVGLPLVGMINGANFRLTTDLSAAAIQAAAEAAQTAAEAAASAATAAQVPPLPNLAAASAVSPAVAPDFVEFLGHTTAGDGGAITLYKVGSEPSSGPKASITYTGSGGGTQWYGPSSGQEVFYPEQFGAFPGASTNRTQLLAAIEFCRSRGAWLDGRGQMYRSSSAETFNTAGTYRWKDIRFDCTSLPINPISGDIANVAFTFEGGAFGAPQLLTANLAAGSDNPKVATPSITLNEPILMFSRDHWGEKAWNGSAFATNAAYSSFIARAFYSDSTQLVLNVAAPCPLTTANGACVITTPFDVTVELENVFADGPGTAHLAQFLAFDRCRVKFLSGGCEDFGDAGAVAIHCLIGRIPNWYADRTWYAHSGTGGLNYCRGYVLGIAGCWADPELDGGGYVGFVKGDRARHVVTFGAGSGSDPDGDETTDEDRFVCRDIFVERIVSFNGIASVYDEHPGTANCGFGSATVWRGYYAGTEEMITIQGAHSRVGDVTAHGAFTGPVVLVQSTGTSDANPNVISIGNVSASSVSTTSYLLAIDATQGVEDQRQIVNAKSLVGNTEGLIDVNAGRSPVSMHVSLLAGTRRGVDGILTQGAKSFRGSISRADITSATDNASEFNAYLAGTASHILEIAAGQSTALSTNAHFRTSATSEINLGCGFDLLTSTNEVHDATGAVYRADRTQLTA